MKRMSKNEYVSVALGRVVFHCETQDSPVELTDEDIALALEVLGECFDWDFSPSDAVKYCRCVENFSPTLEEETALARMRLIGEKYPAYLAGRKSPA